MYFNSIYFLVVAIVKDKEVNTTSMKIITTLDYKVVSYIFMQVTNWMQIFAVKVIIKIPKAVMFVKIVLSSADPNDGMKLSNITDIKTMLLSFMSSSIFDGMKVLKSSGIFIATANSVREVALSIRKET